MARLMSLPRRVVVLILVLIGLAVPAVIMAQDVLTMDNEEQKDWLTSFVQDRLSTPERQIRLSNIDGALGSDVSIREITISDAEGVWLRVNNARLNWNQAALFAGRLEVRSLAADSIEYIRNAVPVEGAVDLPAPEAGSFQVPELPVAVIIDELSIPSVTFGANVFGLGSEISLAGAMTLDGGNLDANLDIVRLDGPGGTLDLDVAFRNADDTIELGLALVEPENGVIANLLNIENRIVVAGQWPDGAVRRGHGQPAGQRHCRGCRSAGAAGDIDRGALSSLLRGRDGAERQCAAPCRRRAVYHRIAADRRAIVARSGGRDDWRSMPSSPTRRAGRWCCQYQGAQRG